MFVEFKDHLYSLAANHINCLAGCRCMEQTQDVYFLLFALICRNSCVGAITF